MATLVCSAAANAAWACGGTCSRAAWIVGKSGLDAAPPSAIDARRRTSMAAISFVHRTGPERDGQRRSEDGVEYAAPALERAASRCAIGRSMRRRRHELAGRTLNAL